MNAGGSLTTDFAVDKLELERFTSMVNGFGGGFMVCVLIQGGDPSYMTLPASEPSAKRARVMSIGR
jgi:hypothetical protein